MKISGIIYDSIVDGEGIRNTIFFSGCCHCCKGCHNPEIWDKNYGYEFTRELQDEFINKCKDNVLLDGITLSGGDPMYTSIEIVSFIKKFKSECPNLDIWVYSGFTYEDILQDKDMNELLKLCDVLVDGVFIEELRDTTIKFRGSTNQRIIKLGDE